MKRTTSTLEADPPGQQQAVRAAGAVVLRERDGIVEALLVHRDRYHDWTLPKGKLESRELACEAAVREVAEETGVRIRLGVPLDRVSYPLPNGDTKVVDYWVGSAVSEDPRPADDEISAVRWLALDQARARLSHDLDRAVLDQAVTQPPTTALVVLRHAKAVKRSNWDSGESDRPITPYGRRQARRLVRLLSGYGVAAVHSSVWLRCHQTVAPIAAALGSTVTDWAELTESAASAHPGRHRRLWQQLRDAVVRDQVPAVVCGHRPTFPAALETLGVPPRKIRTAEAVVLHLDRDGVVVAQEWHRPDER